MGCRLIIQEQNATFKTTGFSWLPCAGRVNNGAQLYSYIPLKKQLNICLVSSAGSYCAGHSQRVTVCRFTYSGLICGCFPQRRTNHNSICTAESIRDHPVYFTLAIQVNT